MGGEKKTKRINRVFYLSAPKEAIKNQKEIFYCPILYDEVNIY